MQPRAHYTITDVEFDKLRQLIYRHTGISLSDHKRALVCSRLGKRLRSLGLSSYWDYYRLVTQDDADGQELGELINAITTNKTEFFRESHHFGFLTDNVLHHVKYAISRGERPRLRIWSAGTSTGEEAYSIAMTISESIPQVGMHDIRILATDIDTRVLARAEQGVYQREQAAKIPDALLRRYFLTGRGPWAGQVMAKPALRSLIRFRHLNLNEEHWPMSGQFDVIFCRNVVIYFDKPTQTNLFRRFARYLKPDGYLMLGHSESLHNNSLGFYPVGHNIYRCQPSAAVFEQVK